jgi:hypothetical protein
VRLNSPLKYTSINSRSLAASSLCIHIPAIPAQANFPAGASIGQPGRIISRIPVLLAAAAYEETDACSQFAKGTQFFDIGGVKTHHAIPAAHAAKPNSKSIMLSVC